MIVIPALDEKEYFERTVAKSHIVNIPASTEADFKAYCGLLEKEFTVKEKNTTDVHTYAAYQGDGCAVFINYFYKTGELQIVTDEDTAYFSYENEMRKEKTTPQITQVHLENFGISYAIRLSDGRFIVIDGGNLIVAEAERLFNVLKEQSVYEKPVIAAWFMSHPHSDHYYNFFEFYKAYKNEVEIEAFLFHFPKGDDYKNYPRLEKVPTGNPEAPYVTRINEFLELVEDSGAKVYTAHTGQTYEIGDAVCEILSSLDDTVYRSDSVNATSLVIKMHLAGQTVLWTTDANFEVANLAKRYGDYLKADIMQIPHHGFRSGDVEETMEGYDFIRPQVCLLPANEYNAYNGMSSSVKSTRHLLGHGGIVELIHGEHTRVLPMPYTPQKFRKSMHEKSYAVGQSNAGATSWIFTELNTGKKSDFEFTLVNTRAERANVMIEMFFEEPRTFVLGIKTTAPGWVIKKIRINDPKDVEEDDSPISKFSLKRQGIKKGVPFAVRFISDVPIVVSHRKHKATYNSTEIY